MSPSGKVSIEWSDRCVGQMGHRKIGTLGNDFGRCRKVQKRVLGGDGLTGVGWDGFLSSLDTKLRFFELAFLHIPTFQERNWEIERGARLRRPPCPAGWF